MIWSNYFVLNVIIKILFRQIANNQKLFELKNLNQNISEKPGLKKPRPNGFRSILTTTKMPKSRDFEGINSPRVISY